jgi:hypothetical protein
MRLYTARRLLDQRHGQAPNRQQSLQIIRVSTFAEVVKQSHARDVRRRTRVMADVMLESMTSAFVILAALLLAMNAVATIVAVRSETSTATQRILQSCVVWLLPLLGAFFIILFHRLDRDRQGPETQRVRLDGSEIDVGLAARHDGHH